MLAYASYLNRYSYFVIYSNIRINNDISFSAERKETKGAKGEASAKISYLAY